MLHKIAAALSVLPRPEEILLLFNKLQAIIFKEDYKLMVISVGIFYKLAKPVLTRKSINF